MGLAFLCFHWKEGCGGVAWDKEELSDTKAYVCACAPGKDSSQTVSRTAFWKGLGVAPDGAQFRRIPHGPGPDTV